MRRPLIPLLIALITGIIAGNFFDLPYIILLSAMIATLIVLLFTMRKRLFIPGYFLIFFFALLSGFLGIQKQQYLPADHHILQHIDSGKQIVEGIVIESPVSYPDKNVLIVRSLRIIKEGIYIPVTGNIRLVIPAHLTFAYGDFIRFHTLLKKIQRFKNPGSFDYEKYLNRQGIYASGFIADQSGIILLRKNSASIFKLRLESFRMYLKKVIYNNAPSPQREIIEAMTIGDQNGIPAEIRDNFNKTGTSHIFSISGLHIGMVAATAFFFITLLLKSSEYLMLRLNIIKAAAVAAFLLVIFYALIAGMGVTVIRSALMALVFLIALLLGKQRDLYNTLALAGLIILVIWPEALFDISFQLSFLAVSAIIYLVPRFSNPSFLRITLLPSGLQSIIRYLYMSILVCLAATIGTLPLIIFYFNRVSAVTIIANLIAVPLLGTLALAIAMVFLLSAFFSPVVAGFFIKLTSFVVQISVRQLINWQNYPGRHSVLPNRLSGKLLFFIFSLFSS
jgi:competence protein ComEC